MLIHGIPDLPGARELAPGTNIFCGGWEAAVDGVLNDRYKPLDFRFFIGRQSYDPKENPQRGNLFGKIQQGSYIACACARSIALKQCLGLPKPLWHEGTSNWIDATSCEGISGSCYSSFVPYQC